MRGVGRARVGLVRIVGAFGDLVVVHLIYKGANTNLWWPLYGGGLS